MGVEVFLVLAGPEGEVRRILPGGLARLFEMGLVEPADVIGQNGFGLGTEAAIRMVVEEQLGLADQLGQVGVGQGSGLLQGGECLAIGGVLPFGDLGRERGHKL